jgi:hypothetical protein
MADNRKVSRKRVLLTGKIICGKTSTFDCTVRNLSGKGACLRVGSPMGIPETFDLLIGQDTTPMPSRVIWRKERELGIVFQ